MSIKDSMNQFVTDFKEMLKTKNTDKMNEAYLKPLLSKTKDLAQKTSDYIVENAPKAANATKEAINKLQEKINEKKGTSASTTTTTTTTTTKETPKPPEDKPKDQ